jgi:hypothetical protein
MKHYKLLENLEMEKMFNDLINEKLSHLASSPNGNGTNNNLSNSTNLDMVKNLTTSLFSKYYKII